MARSTTGTPRESSPTGPCWAAAVGLDAHRRVGTLGRMGEAIPQSRATRRQRAVAFAALLAAWAAVTSGAVPAARAQERSEVAHAEELFLRGRELAAEGRYAEACSIFEESLRADPAPGTRLNLADCYDHIGRTASAWAIFSELAAAARTTGQVDKARYAEERAAALEPKLSKLVIEVAPGSAVPGLVVELDRQAVKPGSLGVAVPVERGLHRVVARAPGKPAWTRDVAVSVPGVVAVRVEFPGGAAASSAPPRAASTGIPTQRVLGIALAGAGVAGVVVGSVFGLRAKSLHDEAQQDCPEPGRCHDEGFELTEDAQDAAAASTVAFLVGAAALGGGALLFFTAPSNEPARAARLRLRPAWGGQTGRLALEGRW